MAADRGSRDPPAARAALDDVSATEWRANALQSPADRGVAALDDVSATEWRQSLTLPRDSSDCCTR